MASTPGHIVGRHVISPLRHPCPPAPLPYNAIGSWKAKGPLTSTVARPQERIRKRQPGPDSTWQPSAYPLLSEKIKRRLVFNTLQLYLARYPEPSVRNDPQKKRRESVLHFKNVVPSKNCFSWTGVEYKREIITESNPVNTETEGVIESARFKQVEFKENM